MAESWHNIGAPLPLYRKSLCGKISMLKTTGKSEYRLWMDTILRCPFSFFHSEGRYLEGQGRPFSGQICEGGNQHLKKETIPPRRSKPSGSGPGWALYTAFLVTSALPLMCQQALAAPTIWEKANEIMKDVYTQILSISTIAAIVTAAIALLMMNFSRSGRTVDESRAWLKRIIITWVVLNGLGFIMAYVTPFFSGGQWTAP